MVCSEQYAVLSAALFVAVVVCILHTVALCGFGYHKIHLSRLSVLLLRTIEAAGVVDMETEFVVIDIALIMRDIYSYHIALRKSGVFPPLQHDENTLFISGEFFTCGEQSSPPEHTCSHNRQEQNGNYDNDCQSPSPQLALLGSEMLSVGLFRGITLHAAKIQIFAEMCK